MKKQIIDKKHIIEDIKNIDICKYHIYISDSLYYLIQENNSKMYYWIDLTEQSDDSDTSNYDTKLEAIKDVLRDGCIVYELDTLSDIKEFI